MCAQLEQRVIGPTWSTNLPSSCSSPLWCSAGSWAARRLTGMLVMWKFSRAARILSSSAISAFSSISCCCFRRVVVAVTTDFFDTSGRNELVHRIITGTAASHPWKDNCTVYSLLYSVNCIRFLYWYHTFGIFPGEKKRIPRGNLTNNDQRTAH